MYASTIGKERTGYCGAKIRGGSSGSYSSRGTDGSVAGVVISLASLHMMDGNIMEKKSTMISRGLQNRYAGHVTLLSERAWYFAPSAGDKGTMFPETIPMPFAGPVNLRTNANTSSTGKKAGNGTETHISGDSLRKHTR